MFSVKTPTLSKKHQLKSIFTNIEFQERSLLVSPSTGSPSSPFTPKNGLSFNTLPSASSVGYESRMSLPPIKEILGEYLTSPKEILDNSYRYQPSIVYNGLSPSNDYKIKEFNKFGYEGLYQEPSFVTLVNEQAIKRPRRRYHEIERLYTCNFPSCDKSYGALNHLNAHIKFMSHGKRRRGCEFNSN